LGCSEDWLVSGKGPKFPGTQGTTGEKAAELLLLRYQAEVTRLSTRLMKDIVHALANNA
jgi:hypothetical protein